MAAKSINYKNPPQLTDSEQYERWVKEVKLWRMCCKLDKKEQGPALALSQDGSVREAALEIDIDELSADDGVEKIIDKLNGLYLKDENQRIYIAYSHFEKFQRPQEMSIDSYINEFERLNNKVKVYNIELPDAVMAYRLLESANLQPSKSELIRATITSLTY